MPMLNTYDKPRNVAGMTAMLHEIPKQVSELIPQWLMNNFVNICLDQFTLIHYLFFIFKQNSQLD